MLDKTLPWYKIILKRDPGIPLPPGCLPQGYAFVGYQRRISAVIDFGCLGVGDPACDLIVA